MSRKKHLPEGDLPDLADWRRISLARDLKDLQKILSELSYDFWSDDYASIPTWGEQTPEVRRLINAASAAKDLVSWDTTVSPPRYLMRVMNYNTGRNELVIEP